MYFFNYQLFEYTVVTINVSFTLVVGVFHGLCLCVRGVKGVIHNEPYIIKMAKH